MTSKYAGLPDIDTTTPDVYETPDVPASFSYGHDSDSDGDFADGLPASSSGGHLAGVARDSNPPAGAGEEAIDSQRLKPSDARSKFLNANVQLSNGSAGTSRRRYPTSLLPDATSYSLRAGPSSSRPLSSTTRRALKHEPSLQDDDEQSYEPETPTERLRRLRFEIEELETHLDQQRQAEKESTGDVESEESDQHEEEGEGMLPRKDDADKTRPQRRRRKKAPVDQNGELSSKTLFSQMKRMRTDLSRLDAQSGPKEESSQGREAAEARTQRLLEKLADLKQEGMNPDLAAENGGEASPDGKAQSTVSSEISASRFDERLIALEKYIGAREADVDETRPLPPPLLSTLQKLEHQLHLLTQPRHLDTISRRVKVLVTDLERVHEARRKIGDTRPLNVALSSGITISTGAIGQLPQPSTSAGSLPVEQQQPLPPDALQKIDGLFTLLPRIDPLIPLAPHILTRLKSLATLHSSSQTFSRDLQDVEQRVEELKSSETLLSELLSGLGDSLEKNQELVKGNLESLQARLANLDSRLDRLQQ